MVTEPELESISPRSFHGDSMWSSELVMMSPHHFSVWCLVYLPVHEPCQELLTFCVLSLTLKLLLLFCLYGNKEG